MKKWAGIAVCFLIGLMAVQTVQADEETSSMTEKIQEWEQQGVDPNHTEAVEKLRRYVEEHFSDGEFASLHISREERKLGTIILSFTSMPSEAQQEEMRALVEEPAQVEFREAAFTEEQLTSKQQEVDQAIFEEKRFEDQFQVHSTSVDIINNRVQIGINERTEENIQTLEDAFGREWIEVVETEAPQTFDEETGEGEEKSRNGLRRILSLVQSWFQ